MKRYYFFVFRLNATVYCKSILHKIDYCSKPLLTVKNFLSVKFIYYHNVNGWHIPLPQNRIDEAPLL